MIHQNTRNATNGATWQGLYRAGGAAALLAGIVFRRNLAAEIVLFAGDLSPATTEAWFALLQSNRWLGLTFLNVFDAVNYVLVALMFLALCAALGRAHWPQMVTALLLSSMGIGVYLATNTALSMLALSEQYAAITESTRGAALIAAGDALLALGRFTAPGSHPGAGGYISLLLIAAGGMVASVVMRREGSFGRVAPIAGMAANGLDLAYCIAYVLAPPASAALLATMFIPAAGLMFMIWHILTGWKLYQMGRPGEYQPGTEI